MNLDLSPLARHAALLDGQRPERLAEVHELIGVARKRRRRSALAATAAAAAAILVASAVATGEAGRRGTERPPVAPEPSISEPTPIPIPALSPEEIRRHPDAQVVEDIPATASAGAARTWVVCLGDCSRATEPVVGEYQSTLEVSHDGFATGALYALDLSENISHAIDDWYLVDGASGAAVVDSRGHRRAVRAGAAAPVTEVAGPLVYSRSGMAYLDLQARTLHVIDGGDWQWQGASDTWFWGTVALLAGDDGTTVTRVAAVWRRPDGTFAAEVLTTEDSSGGPGMLAAGAPGTLAVVEHFAEPRLAHISTDYGTTWQVREVPAGVASGGSLPADWPTWPTP